MFHTKRILTLQLAIAGCAALAAAVAVILFAPVNAQKQGQMLRYVPSSVSVRLASGTHRPLSSSLFFINGALSMFETFADDAARMDFLLDNFRLASELAPQFLAVYFLGGSVAPVSSGDLIKANLYLEEGSRHNPREWRLLYWIGFNYLQMKEFPRTIEYYKKAAAKPGSPRYLKSNLPMLYYQAGQIEQGIAYLQALLPTIGDERLARIIERKISWLTKMIELESAMAAYRGRYGDWPGTLEDLREEGMISHVPEDPFGQGYYLERKAGKGVPRIRSKGLLNN
jgi:tetratricopeptide (TPR) repeat protein